MLGVSLAMMNAAAMVGGAPVLALSGTPPQATQTVAYTFTPLRTGGTAPFTYSIQAGTLPTGLSLNTSTGVISGTPSGTGTSSGITLRVVDSAGSPATVNLTGLSFTVSAVLAITGTPTSTGTVGVSYSFTPGTTGGRGTKTFSLTGTLPTGLSFSTSTGAITGTPTVAAAYAGLAITATDVDGRSASLSTFTITVASAGGSFTTLDTGTKGAQAVIGGGGLTYTVSGSSQDAAQTIGSFSSGKKKFEMTVNTIGGGFTIGINNASWGLDSAFHGQANSYGLADFGGVGVGDGNIGETITSGTVAVEFDADVGDMYFVTATGRYGPYAVGGKIASGPYKFSITTPNSSGTFTLNFGDSTFVRTNGGSFVGL